MISRNNTQEVIVYYKHFIHCSFIERAVDKVIYLLKLTKLKMER